MKIYTRIKINIDTGQIVEEEAFEYDGPLALLMPEGDPDGPGDPPTEEKKEEGDDADDVRSSVDLTGVPAYLKAFWREFVSSWFGEGEAGGEGKSFKDMVYEDIEYQEGVYDTYVAETGEFTEEYQEKLAGLENTYTNAPYAFDFQILGQTVKNIPKRSLSIIDTLSELASSSYGADVKQSGRKLAGDSYFTPNKGETQYMDYLKDLLQGLPQYSEGPEDPDFFPKSASGIVDLIGNLIGLF
jgi:hypothetical protein